MTNERLPEQSGTERTHEQKLEEVVASLKSAQASKRPEFKQLGAVERHEPENVIERILAEHPDLRAALESASVETYDRILRVLGGAVEEEQDTGERKLFGYDGRSLVSLDFWKQAKPIFELVILVLEATALVMTAPTLPAVFSVGAVILFLKQISNMQDVRVVLTNLREGARNRRRQREIQQIAPYVSEARGAGMSDDKIRAELQEAGWDDDVITESLSALPATPELEQAA